MFVKNIASSLLHRIDWGTVTAFFRKYTGLKLFRTDEYKGSQYIELFYLP